MQNAFDPKRPPSARCAALRENDAIKPGLDWFEFLAEAGETAVAGTADNEGPDRQFRPGAAFNAVRAACLRFPTQYNDVLLEADENAGSATISATAGI